MREKRKRTVVLDFDKPSIPWDMVAIDIIGPIIKSNSGNEYILSIVDIFTRFTTLIPIIDQTKETVLMALESKYLSRFGCPTLILSDNATNFCSNLFESVCNMLGITHRRTPPYHPQGNGTLERANREVKKKLTHLCSNSSRSWDDKIHMVEFAINNAHNTSIGTTPSMLLYGRTMRSPASCLDLLEKGEYIITTPYLDSFRDRLQIIREVAAQWDIDTKKSRNTYVNKKRNLITYDVGDQVLYKKVKSKGTRKDGFTFGYEGPYIIENKISDVTYHVKDPNMAIEKLITAHSDRLKKYISKEQEHEDNTLVNTLEQNNTDMVEDSGETGEIPLAEEEASQPREAGDFINNEVIDGPDWEGSIPIQNLNENSIDLSDEISNAPGVSVVETEIPDRCSEDRGEFHQGLEEHASRQKGKEGST